MKNVMSLIEFAKANGFKSVSKVRENKNGYKFVTLMKEGGGEGSAENIYFSKALSLELETGHVLTSEERADLRTAEVENEAGEARIKIIGTGGDYSDLF